jgi:divalent metal cation (Fe/Co/Zn/Cd) transporter
MALGLALFTIFYNLAEGLFSVWFGAREGTLTLFGFGLDSFVETVSGIGILHLVLRIISGEGAQRVRFEKIALRITGSGFYLLAAGLSCTAIYNFLYKITPETTIAGIIIAVISILIMYALIQLKLKTGKALNSEAIIADAACSKVCLYMSLILLIASGLYEFIHWNGFDSLGGLGLAWFSLKEGKECFEKAKNDMLCSCHKS